MECTCRARPGQPRTWRCLRASSLVTAEPRLPYCVSTEASATGPAGRMLPLSCHMLSADRACPAPCTSGLRPDCAAGAPGAGRRRGARASLVAARASWLGWDVAAYTQQSPREASYLGPQPAPWPAVLSWPCALRCAHLACLCNTHEQEAERHVPGNTITHARASTVCVLACALRAARCHGLLQRCSRVR